MFKKVKYSFPATPAWLLSRSKARTPLTFSNIITKLPLPFGWMLMLTGWEKAGHFMANSKPSKYNLIFMSGPSFIDLWPAKRSAV